MISDLALSGQRTQRAAGMSVTLRDLGAPSLTVTSQSRSWRVNPKGDNHAQA